MTSRTTPSTPGFQWPTTKTGKRLASCPGHLPLGGEQERLPDGSLTELRSMRTYEIAVAIETEAAAAALARAAATIEAMPTPNGPGGWQVLGREAVLAVLRAPE
jgi:hypothetical protein